MKCFALLKISNIQSTRKLLQTRAFVSIQFFFYNQTLLLESRTSHKYILTTAVQKYIVYLQVFSCRILSLGVFSSVMQTDFYKLLFFKKKEVNEN